MIIISWTEISQWIPCKHENALKTVQFKQICELTLIPEVVIKECGEAGYYQPIYSRNYYFSQLADGSSIVLVIYLSISVYWRIKF